ncbi:uncharacterized protein OCT59_000017 [Rhizophagus irregularis]|uniref:uncharacterized protein n=1 Tax=Rhizophagus irregularis TaxID=588596 RepID=UPI001A10507F|nr:hypothetical protein OCT59_000017 [Rhizophagus irregularis]GBC13866.2 hypothetical protein GLOIN_2v1598305 [Rhizophagus irregularis DAOM 181602=DAOM 197198]
MENQESSANTEVPFDVTEITTDDINMEDFSTQSSDMTKKASSGVIKTLITQDLFKEMGKPTSSTVDVTKPVDSENQTPMNDDVTLMDELGLLDREKQSLSKTADVVKETSDLALLRLLALHLLKLVHGKDEVRALVNSEVSEEIPETKCSNDALRKRMKRGWKMYRIFNTIGKEKMAQITSIPLSFILNLTQDDINYMIAKVLKPS